jgi:hypothetical protein
MFLVRQLYRSKLESQFVDRAIESEGHLVVLVDLVTYPGFGEKYLSLSGFPSHSFESAGGSRLIVMLGQVFA